MLQTFSAVPVRMHEYHYSSINCLKISVRRLVRLQMKVAGEENVWQIIQNTFACTLSGMPTSCSVMCLVRTCTHNGENHLLLIPMVCFRCCCCASLIGHCIALFCQIYVLLQGTCYTSRKLICGSGALSCQLFSLFLLCVCCPVLSYILSLVLCWRVVTFYEQISWTVFLA